MKKYIFIIIVSCILLPALLPAQAGMWEWVKGDTTAMNPGIFGVQGIPSPVNEPPGRYASSHWIDTASNLWIYGGDQRADVWKFDPLTIEWTWMAGDSVSAAQNIAAAVGVYSALNTPGNVYQGMCAWVTKNNHFWLMGDENLWQFNPAIAQWAWMGAAGPTNYGSLGMGTSSTLPGSRTETSTAWVDTSGNLWMFGGDLGGLDYNDMWKYDVTTGIWTWMSGTQISEDAGIYGTKGTPSVNNIPPGRSTNISWVDNSGNFWLAGGEALSSDIFYQDVWEFNPQTLAWTWVAGNAGGDPSAPSGANCDTSASNKRGERYENRAVWKICDDLIINYSGAVGSYINSVNDLWAWQPSLNEWTQISSAPANGVYVTQGVPSTSAYPPARVGAVGLTDKHQNIWMFGGSTVRGSWYNDLWEYFPDSACLSLADCLRSTPPPLQTSASSININWNGACNGSASVNVQSGTAPYQYLWQPGNETTDTLSNLCAGTYYVIVTDAGGNRNMDSVVITEPGPLQLSITYDSIPLCAGDSTGLCSSAGFSSYLWSNNAVVPCTYATRAANYTVTVTNAGNCSASAAVTITAGGNTPVTITQDKTVMCPGDTAHLCAPAAYPGYSWNVGDTSPCIATTLSGAYYVTVTENGGCTVSSNRLTVSVYPELAITITVNKDTLEAYNGSTYQWYYNNALIPGATSSVLIAAQNGLYYVAETDSNGCYVTSTAQNISSVSGLEPVSGDGGVQVYPNPSSAGWRLTVTEAWMGGWYEIYDAAGRLINRSEIRNLNTEISLDIAKGIYILKVYSAEKSVNLKLIRL